LDKKIRRVTLNNFQSHKDTVIDFCDGVNVIVGNSDEGKSAVIRGIRSVLLDESKNNFVRHGCDFYKVTIEFDDGVTITRVKGDGRNKYLLYNGKEEKEFSKFKEMPSDVIDVIGHYKVMLDPAGEEVFPVTIGGQHDPYFLISDYFTAPVKARLLGQISGVDVIDRVLKMIQDDVRGNQEQIRDNDLRVRDKEDELKAITPKLNKVEEDVGRTKKLIDNVVGKQEELKVLIDFQEALESVREIDSMERELVQLKKALQMLEEIKFEKWDEKVKRKEELEELLSELVSISKGISESEKQLEFYSSDMKVLDEKVRKIGKCPTCGTELSAKAIDHILCGEK